VQLAAESSANPVLAYGLLAVAGILVGGAWVAREHNRVVTVVLGLLALLALVGGVLWQIDR